MTGINQKEWVCAASADDVRDGSVIGCTVSGVPVALYRIVGEVYATHDICPHARAHLSQGYFEDGRIECPLHQAVFDVRTGERLEGPRCRNVATYPVRIDEGDIYVGLPVNGVER